MALRTESSNSSSSLTLSTTAMSHLVELPVYWHEASSTPTTDWDKWLDLFQLANMAKGSISITELTREANDQIPRVRALLGDMDEDPANKKVVSVRCPSLGEAARKLIKDIHPHTTLWKLKVRELIQLARDSFQIKRNRTLDCHKFFLKNAATHRDTSTFLAHVEWLSCPVRLWKNNVYPCTRHVHFTNEQQKV